MKKSNNISYIRQGCIKVASSFIFSIITITLIILCNRIPQYTINLNDSKYKDSTDINISSHNPYSIKSFFILHDISIAEYSIIMPKSGGQSYYLFHSVYEGVEFCGEEMFNEDSSPTFLYIKNNRSDFTFFTKMIKSESLQSIRTFFLTEIFIFFIAVLGIRIYYLYQGIHRKKNGESKLFSAKDHLKIMGYYSALTVIISILLVFICISPTKEITTLNYKANNNFAALMPYDISKTYYNIKINHATVNDTVTWTSSEIVEFSNIYPEPINETAKELKFMANQNNDGSFEANFSTDNLESKNIQEIRLFFLTTLLLLILSRIGVHFIDIIKLLLTNRKHKNKEEKQKDKRKR